MHFKIFIYEFLKTLHGVVDLTSSFESLNLKRATRFLFARMMNIGWIDIMSARLEDQRHILIDDARLAVTWRGAVKSQADARGLVDPFLEGHALCNANNGYKLVGGVLPQEVCFFPGVADGEKKQKKRGKTRNQAFDGAFDS